VKGCLSFVVLSASFLTVAVTPAQQRNDDRKSRGSSDIYADLGKVPEKARSRPNPLENDPEAVAAGRLLFEDHCAECHGESAEGGKGKKHGPSLRAPEVQDAAPGQLFWLLTNGVVRKGMPVWSRLPEPQRWQLVRYLKSLSVSFPGQGQADAKR
jgi:mono/diheme cytochrome c family protein